MITDFISRICTQTVVYWANPVNDGEGGYTFDEAVEIMGRWEQTSEIVRGQNGKEEMTMARVFVTQDVDEDGYMYLGEIDDLDSNHDDPQEIDGALRIVSFSKVPVMGSTTLFLRKAHLNMGKASTV